MTYAPRSGWDSNPRYACDVYTLSRRAPSTTRPPLRVPVCADASLLERMRWGRRGPSDAAGVSQARGRWHTGAMRIVLAALTLALVGPPLTAQDKAAEPPTPASVLAASKPGEWHAIDPNDLLVMTSRPTRKPPMRRVDRPADPAAVQPGLGRQRPHSRQGALVGRHQRLPRGRQLGRPMGRRRGRSEESQAAAGGDQGGAGERLHHADAMQGLPVPARRSSRRTASRPFRALELIDPYDQKGQAGFSAGWPVAVALASSGNQVWPVHCYGSVGVARDLSPDTGTGAELYAVIGQAPRQLDRNIAVVGRVIEGIENLCDPAARQGRDRGVR